MKMRLAWAIALGVAGSVAVAAVGGALFVASGVYDVAASTQHTQPVFSFLKTVMRQSVRFHARSVEAPAAPAVADPLLRGAACLRAHCVACHGAPGEAPAGFSLGLQPLPPPLVDVAHAWSPAELYWITRKGLKMTAMPAWEWRIDEPDLWALVALMEQLPSMTPADWRGLSERAAALRCERGEPAAPLAPSVERGRKAMQQFGCAGCHVIDGVTGGRASVGPPLSGHARRERLPGGLPNTHEQLVRWLRDPRALDPATAMPDLGLGEQDARDIAAYLATLH